MKKILLTLLLSLMLVLTLTGCGGSDSQGTDAAKEEETQETVDAVEPPVADTKGDTGLPGTWRTEDEEAENEQIVQLALNSNGTFELYTEVDSNTDDNESSSVTGTYTSTDTELTLTPDEGEIDVFAVDGDSATMSYTVDATTLVLTDSKGQTQTLTRI